MEKSRKEIQAKALQGHVPWLNLKKNFQISFLQYANNVGTPSAQPRSRELWMQKFKSHLVRTQSLNVLRLKPGVGQ